MAMGFMIIMRRIIIVVLSLISSTAYGTSSSTTINTTTNTQTITQTFILNSPLLKSHPTARIKVGLVILTDAFSALGIKVEFRYRPDKRSVTEANTGLVDGEFARTSDIAQRYPNLVVVPEKLGVTNIVAFSLGQKIDLSDYKINQHQYNIGYMSGWANVSALLKDYRNKVAVVEYDVLFKFLVHKRVDLVLYNPVAGEKILRNRHIYDYQMSQSLLFNETFLVLNKKHAALAPQLAIEIKRAKIKYAQKQRAEPN